ncbi:MAG: SPOR domain-containing protein [Candidatus Omnitrophica bacterium]|nr:SPOR domain-containing protein [Candidatus Omnitrophota bacterium]
MTRHSKDSPPGNVRALTEREIQERLYGEYLGRRKTSERPVPDPPNDLTSGYSSWDSEWTGAEILTSELKKLRNDLIALRQERERLAGQLEQHIHSCQTAPGGAETGVQVNPKKSAWGLLRKGTVALILAACVGMPVGFQFLHASPTGSEPSPYTIQVAVYDVKAAADRALVRLQELGYPAFFVEYPRYNGKPRYRIYVGRFITKVEAQLEQERLMMDPRFSDAFVRLQ